MTAPEPPAADGYVYDCGFLSFPQEVQDALYGYEAEQYAAEEARRAKRAGMLPVCLGCAFERYRDQYNKLPEHREWPTPPRTCHVCGMITNMGYWVRPALQPSPATEET